MLTKSSTTNSYNIDAVIQVDAKLYNVISILEDDPKTSKKLVLDLLKKEYSDLTPILLDNFDYNETTEKFKIRKNTKFKTHIDVRLRIKYYLIRKLMYNLHYP